MAGSDTKDSHGTSSNAQSSSSNSNQSSSHPANTSAAPSQAPVTRAGSDTSETSSHSSSSSNSGADTSGSHGSGNDLQAGYNANQGANVQGQSAVQAGVAAAGPAWTVSTVQSGLSAAGAPQPVTGWTSGMPSLAEAVASGALSTRAGLEGLAEAAAIKYGIPANLLKGVISQESMWDINAVSGAGAVGLTQLIPKYAVGPKGLGVNPYNPVQNIEGGAKYLGQLYGKYGNWTDTLSAYNLGPTAYDKVLAGTRILPKETAEYPGKVLAYANGYGGIEVVEKNSALTAIRAAVGDTGGIGFDPLPAPKPLTAGIPPKPSPVRVISINPDGTSVDTGRDVLRETPTELIARKVRTIAIDPETNQPVITFDDPGAGPQNWFGAIFAKGTAKAADNDANGVAAFVMRPAVLTGITTEYVAPDGTVRTVQPAATVALPPGVVPQSVAFSWWEKVLGRPAANANVAGGTDITGSVLDPIKAATSDSGGVTTAVMSYAAVNDTGAAVPSVDFPGISITVQGGAPQARTFADVLDTHADAINTEADTTDTGTTSNPILAGLPVAGGALDGIVSTVANWFSSTDATQATFGGDTSIGSSLPSGGNSAVLAGGNGASSFIRHNPISVDGMITDNPFAPQYFGLDDLAALLNGGSGAGADGNGSLGSSGTGSISPTLIIAGLVAAGAAFFFLRHKVAK